MKEKRIRSRNGLKLCPKCGGYIQTRPGWPGHEDEVVSCLCPHRDRQRIKDEKAKRHWVAVDEA